jgi:hypothetical protein
MFGGCGYDAGLVDHAALDACCVERGFLVKTCRSLPDCQLTSAGAKYLVPAQERPRGNCSAGSLGAVLTTVLAHRGIP